MDEDKRIFRAAAVEQARQIQKQKQIQDQVYDTIIEFIDLPHDASPGTGTPSVSDLQHFRNGVSLFSPEEFDQMAIERNIYGKCGYALCTKKVVSSSKQGSHAVLWAKVGVDLNVVPRSELPKWCSLECEKYANLIKKQLLREPAWERRGSLKKIQIPFLTKGTVERCFPESEDRMSDDTRNSQELTNRMKELSVERGELEYNEKKTDIRLIERPTTRAATVPSQAVGADSSTIEGYLPQASSFNITRKHDDNDDDEDMMDM